MVDGRCDWSLGWLFTRLLELTSSCSRLLLFLNLGTWLLKLRRLIILDFLRGFMHVAKVFKDVNKLGSLFFNVSLVGVTYKVHIYFAINAFLLLFRFFWVKGIFFFEMIKVFIADF